MREPCSDLVGGEGKVWTVADLTGGLVSCCWQTHPKHLKDTPSSYKCFELSNFKSELNREHSAAIACSQTHTHTQLLLGSLLFFFKVNCVFHKGTLSTIADIQGGSNMTGTDLYKRTHKSVPVIFEPPCIIKCPTRCNNMQSIFYFTAILLYMFRVPSTPIIRST